MTNRKFIDIAGWVGVVLILLAYSLNIFGVVESSATLYQALNAVGAIGIIIDGVGKRDIQPVVLNIVWLAIAVIAVLGQL
jgi:uncharacterized membrane protein